jgi:hypothetical protein
MGGDMIARLILIGMASLFFLTTWESDTMSYPRTARLIVAVQLAAALWVLVH